MSYVLLVAGASNATCETISAISGKSLAPDGEVIRLPLRGNDACYTQKYVNMLVKSTCDHLSRRSESEPVSVLLLYLNLQNGTEKYLLDAFFPMALPLGIDLQGPSGTEELLKGKGLKGEVVKGAQRLRKIFPQVSDKTQVANLSPLLLPVRNFRALPLKEMLSALYSDLSNHESPGELIKEKVEIFKTSHPPVKPPDGKQHCYTDGYLFFKSPGRDRHGFFRNSGKGSHADDCIMRARSRLGGSIPYTLHYDCTPVRKLAKNYPNCHGHPTPPKDRHVNIGPSDFII